VCGPSLAKCAVVGVGSGLAAEGYGHGPRGWRASFYASSALGGVTGGVAERPRTQKSREVPHYFAVMNTSFLECVCGSKPSGWDLHRHGQYPSSTASKSKMPKFSPTSWVPKVFLRGIPSQILPPTRDKKTGKLAKQAAARLSGLSDEVLG